MRHETQVLLTVVVAVAAAVAFTAGFVLLHWGGYVASLPVAAGTFFNAGDQATWNVHFSVGPQGGRLTGAWTAYRGQGIVALVVVNGTGSKPPPPPGPFFCPAEIGFTESPGSVDQILSPGPYTVYWNTGACVFASQIVVTQRIEVVGV